MSDSFLGRLPAMLAGWPRRLLALCCLMMAALSALSARSSAKPAQEHTAVLVAARNLSAGHTLLATDVSVRHWPADLVAAGTLTRRRDVVGKTLAVPIRVGEPLAGTRLVAKDLTRGLPDGYVATPVSVRSATFVQPGDHVDLLIADVDTTAQSAPSAGVARTLAEDAQVLAVLSANSESTSAGTAQLLVAVTRTTALRIAATDGRSALATLRDTS